MHRTCLIGLLLFGVVSPARGQTGGAAEPTPAQIAEARVHFERGTTLYDGGSYAEAEAEFRAAYAITPHPDLLYNIYTAAERNGDTARAVEALRGYLEDGEMEDTRRAALELRLERLSLRLDREAIASEEAARVEAERERRLAEEQRQRAAAQAEADREREQRLAGIRAGQATSDTLLYLGLGGLAAGGVGAVLFGVFAGLSEAEDQSLASTCGRDGGRVCFEDEVAELERWNTAADVSWIAGAGLGLVGAVLLVIGEATRPSEAAAEVSVQPLLGPRFAGLRVGRRW